MTENKVMLISCFTFIINIWIIIYYVFWKSCKMFTVTSLDFFFYQDYHSRWSLTFDEPSLRTSYHLHNFHIWTLNTLNETCKRSPLGNNLSGHRWNTGNIKIAIEQKTSTKLFLCRLLRPGRTDTEITMWRTPWNASCFSILCISQSRNKVPTFLVLWKTKKSLEKCWVCLFSHHTSQLPGVFSYLLSLVLKEIQP